MEEKVLIKSEQYNVKKFFKIMVIIGTVLMVAAWLPGLIGIGDIGIGIFLEVHVLPSLVILAVFALVGGIVYICLSGFELTVTDKRIFGNVHKKRVDLPLDSVSAVSMGAFKSIAVATSSGRISFAMIKNRNDIHKVVSGLLVERQNKAKEATPVKVESASNADELKKYKDLLDSGIITQEEFDAKKKQLLGL